MKVGDKVVLVGNEHEDRELYEGMIGAVGTVLVEPYHQSNLFTGKRELLVEVLFTERGLSPWVKNLRPVKDYYIQQFKKVYESTLSDSNGDSSL